jgi:hypothetical protein
MILLHKSPPERKVREHLERMTPLSAKEAAWRILEV